MTTIAVEQPNYIPWIGYFDLISQSDVWVWYDEVQYTKRDWRNRNRVAGDAAEWLTIPVLTKGRFHQRIGDVALDESQPWKRRHLDTLRRCYSRAPHFDVVHGLVESAFDAGDELLADLTIRLNESICALLQLTPRFVRSSALVRNADTREGRLLEICRLASADVYLSGPAARAYIAKETFASAGIELRYIVYDYPPYVRGSRPFVPHLSIVDMLAWLGTAGTAEYLSRHSRYEVEACA